MFTFNPELLFLFSALSLLALHLFVEFAVPRGSLLSPILFLVLIRNIDCEIVLKFLSSFANATHIG